MPPKKNKTVEDSPAPKKQMLSVSGSVALPIAETCIAGASMKTLRICSATVFELLDSSIEKSAVFKAADADSIPQAVRDRYDPIVLPQITDMETRCCVCGCTAKGHPTHPPMSALEILREEEEKMQPPATEIEWQFTSSHRASSCQNIEFLRSCFQEACDTTLQNQELEVAEEGVHRKPLLIAIKEGHGIGKSYCVDMLDELLFLDDPLRPLVLKVTYNNGQSLAFETGGDRHHEVHGLYARLAIAVNKMLSPKNACGVVEKMVVSDSPFTLDTLINYIAENAKGRRIALAVDELGNMSRTGGLEHTDDVLNALSNLVLGLKNKGLYCVCFVTALPHVKFPSRAGRRVHMIGLPLLESAQSRALLRQTVAEERWKSLKQWQIQEVLAWCGGHPRAIVEVGDEISKGLPDIPRLPQVVALKCHWNCESVDAASVVEYIKQCYMNQNETQSNSRTQTLMRENSLLYLSIARGPKLRIPPVALFGFADNNLLKHPNMMFDNSVTGWQPNVLENVHIHWDYFRRQTNLPVIPPSLMGSGAFITRSPLAFGNLKYSFSSHLPVVRSNIFNGSSSLAIEKIEESSYYAPSDIRHPHIESMCVGTIEGSNQKVLCLFQSKHVNSSPEAYKSIKKAAKLLEQVWNNPFLFVIVVAAADDNSMPASCIIDVEDNVLLITADNADNYFTSTLAPVMETLVLTVNVGS